MSVASTMPMPDGGHLIYDLRGPAGAPSILLLRPAGGAMALWGSFRDVLAEKLRVISFDPRGQGDSSAAPKWWSPDEMAEDALALLDLLAVERAHVFGISLGGMVAMHLALAHAQRVDHLVLASTVARGGVPRMSSLVPGARVARCLLVPGGGSEACQVEQTTGCDSESVEAAKARARRLSPERRTLASSTIAALRHDVRADLSHIEIPTLVLGGTRDRLTPPDIARELARRIPGAALRLIDAGHDLTIDRPHVAARAILSFLEAPDHAPSGINPPHEEANP